MAAQRRLSTNRKWTIQRLTDNVIGTQNKKTSFCVYGFNTKSIHFESISLQEKMDAVHYQLAPAFYKHSMSSYFNEAEYTTKGGQWISRFWDASTYAELIETKKKYDPKIRFACIQCVGDINGDNLGN